VRTRVSASCSPLSVHREPIKNLDMAYRRLCTVSCGGQPFHLRHRRAVGNSPSVAVGNIGKAAAGYIHTAAAGSRAAVDRREAGPSVFLHDKEDTFG